MARATKTLELRGRTFKVTQMSGMKGIRIFYRLSGIVIPTLTKLGKGLELLENGLNADVQELLAQLPQMHDAASLFFEKLPEAEFEKLIREVLDGATVKPLDGSDEQPLLPIFDEEMAGETSAILQLVGFALKVHFGNFMPGLVAQAKAAMPATKAASQSKG